MVLEGLLVIIKPIYINEMTILVKKISQFDPFRPKLWPFYKSRLLKRISPKVFHVFKGFSPSKMTLRPFWSSKYPPALVKQ